MPGFSGFNLMVEELPDRALLLKGLLGGGFWMALVWKKGPDVIPFQSGYAGCIHYEARVRHARAAMR